jgi:hypothetical protein
MNPGASIPAERAARAAWVHFAARRFDALRLPRQSAHPIRPSACAPRRPPPARSAAGYAEELDALAEIEGATARLKTEARRHASTEGTGLTLHANFINAAFAYWRPRELNRFNGPDAEHGMRR